MKKFFLLLLAALPFVMTSCGDDDEPEMTLNKSEITLNYGATDNSLKCNLKNPVWGSSNEFVATVDGDGKVTARHEGTAKITATAGGQTASAVVTVKATNNNFRMPILSFGQTKEQIASQMKAWEADGVFPLTLSDDTDALAYLPKGLNPGYGYNFKNNKLYTASLTLTEDQGDEGDIYVFVGQRYQKYGEGSNDTEGYDYTLYSNADDPDNSTIVVQVIVFYDTLDYSIYWAENRSTKTRAADIFSAPEFKAAREVSRRISAAARK
ncbi:MAG: Ig-like domain-containing protein [Muribaculaceae bacterium]|nr:Ig-like domain-containing protein [Muribaculaceae bacterium]